MLQDPCTIHRINKILEANQFLVIATSVSFVSLSMTWSCLFSPIADKAGWEVGKH